MTKEILNILKEVELERKDPNNYTTATSKIAIAQGWNYAVDVQRAKINKVIKRFKGRAKHK